MAQRKRHYNYTSHTLEVARQLFADAMIYEVPDRAVCALASDLVDVFEAGETLTDFRANIGGLRNLGGYVDVIRNNYFES